MVSFIPIKIDQKSNRSQRIFPRSTVKFVVQFYNPIVINIQIMEQGQLATFGQTQQKDVEGLQMEQELLITDKNLSFSERHQQHKQFSHNETIQTLEKMTLTKETKGTIDLSTKKFKSNDNEDLETKPNSQEDLDSAEQDDQHSESTNYSHKTNSDTSFTDDIEPLLREISQFTSTLTCEQSPADEALSPQKQPILTIRQKMDWKKAEEKCSPSLGYNSNLEDTPPKRQARQTERTSPNNTNFLERKLILITNNCVDLGSPEDSSKTINDTNVNSLNQTQSNIIRQDLILSDQRTKIMIRNVPKEYTLEKLKEEISELGFTTETYHKITIPGQKEKETVSYAFIHLKSPELVLRFYKQMNIKFWKFSPKAKRCTLCYSKQTI